MISNAFNWLESKDFRSWLSFIIIFFDATDKRYLDILFEPFFTVAKHDKEFCNFLLMMFQKMEDEHREGRRSYSLDFIKYLKEKREEFSAILAKFTDNNFIQI